MENANGMQGLEYNSSEANHMTGVKLPMKITKRFLETACKNFTDEEIGTLTGLLFKMAGNFSTKKTGKVRRKKNHGHLHLGMPEDGQKTRERKRSIR
jgi:hypothetical protein